MVKKSSNCLVRSDWSIGISRGSCLNHRWMLLDLTAALTPSAACTHGCHPQPSPSLSDLDLLCSPPPASASPEIEASPPSNHGCLARRQARRSINLAGPDARVACLGSPATRTGQRHRLPRLRPRPATGSGRLSQVIDEIHLHPAFILGSFLLVASDLFVICTR